MKHKDPKNHVCGYRLKHPSVLRVQSTGGAVLGLRRGKGRTLSFLIPSSFRHVSQSISSLFSFSPKKKKGFFSLHEMYVREWRMLLFPTQSHGAIFSLRQEDVLDLWVLSHKRVKAIVMPEPGQHISNDFSNDNDNLRMWVMSFSRGAL